MLKTKKKKKEKKKEEAAAQYIKIQLSMWYQSNGCIVHLRGYCTSFFPGLTCFVLYLKIINIVLKNDICILQ